ncbi:Vav1 [Acrasis kona]|uniref:Vav1 n=1 Tax=Acrasis kona TaxID=1008807 RepID=A0AAW2ZFI2_9EUKA
MKSTSDEETFSVQEHFLRAYKTFFASPPTFWQVFATMKDFYECYVMLKTEERFEKQLRKAVKVNQDSQVFRLEETPSDVSYRAVAERNTILKRQVERLRIQMNNYKDLKSSEVVLSQSDKIQTQSLSDLYLCYKRNQMKNSQDDVNKLFMLNKK